MASQLVYGGISKYTRLHACNGYMVYHGSCSGVANQGDILSSQISIRRTEVPAALFPESKQINSMEFGGTIKTKRITHAPYPEILAIKLPYFPPESLIIPESEFSSFSFVSDLQATCPLRLKTVSGTHQVGGWQH